MPNPVIQPSAKQPLSQTKLFEFDRHEAAIQSASPILVICASSMQGFDSFNTPKALGFERLITQHIGLASGQRMIQMEVKIRQ